MANEEVRKDSDGTVEPPVDIETLDTANTNPETVTEGEAGPVEATVRPKRKKAAGKGGTAKGKAAKSEKKPATRKTSRAKKGEAAGAAGGETEAATADGPVQPEETTAETTVETTAKTAAEPEKSIVTAAAPEVSVLQGARIEMAGSKRTVAQSAPTVIAQQPAQGIVKVRNIDATLANITAHIIPNKVIVQGTVHLQIFFVTSDQMVHHLAEDVPFHAMLEIPGAQPGMKAVVQPRIAAVLFHLSDDGLSLVKKVIIDVFAKVVEEVQLRPMPGSGPVLLLQEVVGEGIAQTLSENFVTLDIPAVKVDEIRGELREITTEVIPGKVIVQGVIHKQIFFVDTEGVSRHQAEDVGFSVFVDIPGAAPGMNVQIEPRIETILFELLDPTTLRQKVVVEVFVKVTTAVQFQAALGEGPLVRVPEVVGTGEGQILRRDVVALERPAAKIREIVASLQELREHVIPGKVILQGVIHKQIFFIGLDDIEYHQAENVPFSLMVDIPGASPGQELVAEPVIESVLFNLVNPSELEEKVIIRASLVLVDQRQVRLAVGNGPLVKVEQVVGENLSQVLVRLVNVFPFAKRAVPITVVSAVQGVVVFRQQAIVENAVELPVTAIKVAEVSAIVANLRATPIQSGLLVEGDIIKDVRFVGDDDIVRNVSETVPFSVIVNIPSSGKVQSVEVRIEQILFSISPDGRSVRQVIVISAEVAVEESTTQQFQLITEVEAPGLIVDSVLVEEPVLTPDGVILRQFPVITGLSGPGLALVVDAVFGEHTLNVVGVGPQTLNVLESIVLDP